MHWRTAEEKLDKKWWDDIVQFYVYQNDLKDLLHGKKLNDIIGYATGEYDLEPFKRMYRSLRAQAAAKVNPNIPNQVVESMDKTGIQWERTPLIPSKINAAVAAIQKIPFEITCTCTDPLAQKKKKKDLEHLRNKPYMEDALQPLYDELNLGKPDVGPTEFSDIPYNSLPLDLDIDDDNEFMIFANLIYNLAPETAFEVLLQHWYDTKKISQTRLLETKDQYYYAVSVNQCLDDKMVGLPVPEYVYPGAVSTDGSKLPDFSDNIIRIVSKDITPLELFHMFPDEICTKDKLEEIVTGGKGYWGESYCSCNNRPFISTNDWGSFKMRLEYIEVKSIDYTMIAKKPKSRFSYPTDDPKKCSEKIWAQNTYCCYWLRGTRYFFGIDRLGFAHRKEGQETYQSFSTNIYKSNEKSAVELSIGENKKAQIAEIKLQHNIIMSLPPGRVIDLKGLRSAIEGLKDEMGTYTLMELVDKALEHNIHIIDTEGYEGKQNAYTTSVKELPGGLAKDIEGYYRVILEADLKISQYTNINQQLTGQSANPEGLIGMQKLLINSALNGLYYVNEAITAQYQPLFNLAAYHFKRAVENGGAAKQAIINIIGSNKTNIIDGLKDVPVHQIGTKITLGQREEERALFKAELAKMRQEGRISAAAEYYVWNTANPKDAMFLLSMFEKRSEKREDAARQQQIEAQQQLMQQQGQNVLANTQQQGQMKIQQIQAQAEAEAQLMKLGDALGLSKAQMETYLKLQLQTSRLDQQTDKALRTLYAKQNFDRQQPLT